tara:strand:+ start:288 stop:425 length:138 start_codon:yes stop_codon:yes gene_type:complete
MELPPEKTLFNVQLFHLIKIAKRAVDDLTKLHTLHLVILNALSND